MYNKYRTVIKRIVTSSESKSLEAHVASETGMAKKVPIKRMGTLKCYTADQLQAAFRNLTVHLRSRL
jgi:hypothetical protein